MTTEKFVSKTVYETWPTGATRHIEHLETNLRETCNFLECQLINAIQQIENTYKPEKEVLEKDSKQRNAWKNIDYAKMSIKNRINRIHPDKR